VLHLYALRHERRGHYFTNFGSGWGASPPRSLPRGWHGRQNTRFPFSPTSVPIQEHFASYSGTKRHFEGISPVQSSFESSQGRRHRSLIDISGQRFGMLLVTAYAGVKTFPSGKTLGLWGLVCDCGRTVERIGSDLRRGHTTHCGCQTKYLGLVGQRSGCLLVSGYANKSSNRDLQVNCKCDCGGHVTITASAFARGHDDSCGNCLQNKIRPQIPAIIQRYLSGIGCPTLAKDFGTSEYTICRLLQTAGVSLRTRPTFSCPLGNRDCRKFQRCQSCREEFNLCSGCQKHAAAPEAKQCIKCLKKGTAWGTLQRKRNQRARHHGAPGICTSEQWRVRCEYFGWRCHYCHCPLTERTATQDHKIPLSKGGTNWPANLVPACLTCNSRKGTKSFLQFRRQRSESVISRHRLQEGHYRSQGASKYKDSGNRANGVPFPSLPVASYAKQENAWSSMYGSFRTTAESSTGPTQ